MDAPVPTSTKGRRDLTNVPAQSLTMMNDPFVISLAERLAKRVRDNESLKSAEAQISQMFQLALNRQPKPVELANAKVFIEDLAAMEKAGATSQDPWRVLAQAVFNLKEFIYLQ